MNFRHAVLSACALFLTGADDPDLPEALASYVEDGEFDPGNFGYLRGYFSDATEAEQGQFAEISQWSAACKRPATEAVIRRLAERGVDLATDDRLLVSPVTCRQPTYIPVLPQEMTYSEFRRELDRVRPIYETYLMAVGLAEDVGGTSSDDFGRALEQRTLADQMTRHAQDWGHGVMATAPELSPVGLAILKARMGMETARIDHANTEWLKAQVAKHGWPTISDVGEEASLNAWLLAQHADADPVFQLDALRLMEPLVAEDEVSKQNYAYLYDRVMLKLTGQQRYATQFRCVDGGFVPEPMEDAAQVERLRRDMGLSTLEEYTQLMRDSSGRCG